MAQLFEDLPEALSNSVEVAKRCNLELSFGKYYLPAYPLPAERTIDAHIRELAHDGLQARLAKQTTAPEMVAATVWRCSTLPITTTAAPVSAAMA